MTQEATLAKRGTKPDTSNGTSVNVQEQLTKAAAKAKAIQQQQIDDLSRKKESPKGVSFAPHLEQDQVTLFTNRWIDGTKETGYTCPPEKFDDAIARGYAPVIDDRGEQVRVGGDLGFSRPKEITEAEMQKVVDLNRQKVKAMDAALGAAAQPLASTGTKVDIEETEVSKE